MIELFQTANLDWMGKAKFFFYIKRSPLAHRMVRHLLKGGIKYGIDSGRHQRDVALPILQTWTVARQPAAAKALGNSEIQGVSDIATLTPTKY